MSGADRKGAVKRLEKNCCCGGVGDRGNQGEIQRGANRHGEKPHSKIWTKLCPTISAQREWMDLMEEKHLGSV